MMTDVRSPNTHRMCISGLRTSVYSDTLNRVRPGLLRQFVNQVMQREAPPVLAQDFLCPYRRLVQIRAGRRRHL